MEPIVIHIESGVVRAVSTTSGHLPAPVVIIDLDCEGLDEDDLVTIAHDGGGKTSAHITVHTAHQLDEATSEAVAELICDTRYAVISETEQDENGNPLYWNIRDGYLPGWQNATTFTAAARAGTGLPDGGRWIVWDRPAPPAVNFQNEQH